MIVKQLMTAEYQELVERGRFQGSFMNHNVQPALFRATNSSEIFISQVVKPALFRATNSSEIFKSQVVKPALFRATSLSWVFLSKPVQQPFLGLPISPTQFSH